eukprot:CAMPEP_0172870884 /NCGR_PEP_ID=MMETSP1075-20121228/91773_1 /TAXON_ID=2916 /ORGANISM="Ceratium fusus, Strain PA161109" /LENGTH=322 /DNA_ID=CAMNT_0013721061 /DNA_START=30 /DNA_END=995 /DNA_ORIENTATION=-
MDFEQGSQGDGNTSDRLQACNRHFMPKKAFNACCGRQVILGSCFVLMTFSMGASYLSYWRAYNELSRREASRTRILQDSPCAAFPFIRLEKILHSNLGGRGPDQGDEGIVYRVSMSNVGVPVSRAELRLHAYTPYVPSAGRGNSLNGEWASIAWEPGTWVGLVANFWDPHTKQNLTLPRGYLSFCDIDAGIDGEKEFVTVSNFFENYYVGNTATAQVEEHKLTTTFWGNEPGFSGDSPKQGMSFTPAQKRKTVTFQVGAGGLQAAVFKFGALPGSHPRSIQFAFQPTLLCTRTQMPDGKLLTATELSPGNIFPLANGKETVK